jgi:hypothetical protein
MTYNTDLEEELKFLFDLTEINELEGIDMISIPTI